MSGAQFNDLNFSFFFFPLCPLPLSAAANLRPGAEQKVVFITARVHPGETPSSFVCQGECLPQGGRSAGIWSPPAGARAGWGELCLWNGMWQILPQWKSANQDISRVSHLIPSCSSPWGCRNSWAPSLAKVCWTWSGLDRVGLWSCLGGMRQSHSYTIYLCKGPYLRAFPAHFSGVYSVNCLYFFLPCTISSFFSITKQWP